ncbi:MAG TPA: site-specific DNA-methyltransferase [Thermodesulfobacteriota bacterium]|nr:site-specific DNA-methyltransferase [Thermodesulfobacteriota bacterium]
MAIKQKLELTWIGKENRPRLEPRILLEDPDRSYHTPHRVTDQDIYENGLIFGDNLLALKALEQGFTAKIKSIYIDPPYNTGSAFEHYEDGIEHSTWLSLMRERLELLQKLLREDGTIWVSIDDNECHYLKVLMDEIFGRNNFLTTICWEKIYTLKNTAKHFSEMHDFILVYAKNIEHVSLSLLERGEKQNVGFKNPDNDSRGPWIDSAMHGRNFYSKGSYSVTSPSGKIFQPPPGRYWTVSKENFHALDQEKRVWWGKGGSNAPRKKTFLNEVRQGVVPGTIWFYKEAGQNAEAKNEIKALFAETSEIFITPKPEKLIKQILTISTQPGDWVLDSFAGTGTTGAVAHKMGRRWIMVELGEHCHTHIIPRMKKVIDGTDTGGITEAVGWKGGGGFRYYRLGPSLLEKDRFGNWIINKKYNAAMLAGAICKLEGFTYAPSEEVYWQHGHSTENDFIYVTTQTLTREQFQRLSDEVGEGRSLLVMCGAFRVKNLDDFPNLTVKKIPKAVMNRCEWGKDDYSLEIKNLPFKPIEETSERETMQGDRLVKGKNDKQTSLFSFDGKGKSK